MKISKITLGTVNFGLDYGLRKKRKNKISKKKSILIIKKAIKLGINSFDTSPNYGNAENILGKTIRKNSKCSIATKILIPSNKKINFKKILISINNSRKSLNKENLDLIQIHNANERAFKNLKLKDFFMTVNLLKISASNF